MLPGPWQGVALGLLTVTVSCIGLIVPIAIPEYLDIILHAHAARMVTRVTSD